MIWIAMKPFTVALCNPAVQRRPAWPPNMGMASTGREERASDKGRRRPPGLRLVGCAPDAPRTPATRHNTASCCWPARTASPPPARGPGLAAAPPAPKRTAFSTSFVHEHQSLPLLASLTQKPQAKPISAPRASYCATRLRESCILRGHPQRPALYILEQSPNPHELYRTCPKDSTVTHAMLAKLGQNRKLFKITYKCLFRCDCRAACATFSGCKA